MLTQSKFLTITSLSSDRHITVNTLLLSLSVYVSVCLSASLCAFLYVYVYIYSETLQTLMDDPQHRLYGVHSAYPIRLLKIRSTLGCLDRFQGRTETLSRVCSA